MISEEAKTAIDALSKDELRLEVNKANRSRFQGDKFAYVQSRLQRLEEAAQTDQHRAELAATTEANQIARQANAIATEANAISKKAWRISVLSAVIAIVAVVVSMWARK
jgi:anti-sigma-K factor RskA